MVASLFWFAAVVIRIVTRIGVVALFRTWRLSSGRAWVRHLTGCAALAVLSGAGTAVAAETLRVSGTGGVMPVLKQLIDDYSRQATAIRVEIVYPPTGTIGAIRGVTAGNLDVGFGTRAVQDGESSVKLQSARWVKTAFVITANHPSASAGFTRAQLASIWSGATTRWPDGQPIRLVLRPPNDADITSLRALSPEMSRAVDSALSRPGLPRGENDLHNLELISQVPGAIGGNTLGLLLSSGSKLSAAPLDGVTPGPRTLQDGSYPYVRTIHLITREGVKENAFVTYLNSARAMAILERNGFVAARP